MKVKENLIKRFEERKNRSLDGANQCYTEHGKFLGLNEYQEIKYLDNIKKQINEEFKELKKIINSLDDEAIKNLDEDIKNLIFLIEQNQESVQYENEVIKHFIYALDEIQFLNKSKTPWKAIKRQVKKLKDNLFTTSYQVQSVRIPKPLNEIEYTLTRNLKGYFKDDETLISFVKELIKPKIRFNAKDALKDHSKPHPKTEEKAQELFKNLPIMDLSDPRS